MQVQLMLQEENSRIKLRIEIDEEMEDSRFKLISAEYPN